MPAVVLLHLAARPLKTDDSGQVAERSNAPVLKTGEPHGSGGSNPSLSVICPLLRVFVA